MQFLHKRMGLVPGWGGTTRLCRIVGPRKALHLMTSGRPLSADEALSIGLADDVIPKSNDLEDSTDDVANEWLERTFALSNFDCDVLRSMKTVVMDVEKSNSVEESIRAESKMVGRLWGQGANLRAVNAIRHKE